MSLVVGSFLICWMPITLNFLVVAVTMNRHFFYEYNATLGYAFGFLTVVATHLNSAIDPLIYSYRMKKVRNAIKNLFSKRPANESKNSSSFKISDFM